MRRGALGGALALAATLMMSADLKAQEAFVPRGHVGISFLAADPVGDLGFFFEQGFGLQLEGAVPMSDAGHLRLRGDLGFVIYGIEHQHMCYSSPIGCRIATDLTTTNSILFGGIGPEVVFTRGPIQPYAHGTVGFSYFATTSSLEDFGYDDYAHTTNFSDAVLAWKLGGGVRVRVKDGHRPVSLDFAVERHENGVADFLTKGDIIDNPDGSITVFPNRSEANLLTFRIGVSIGLGSREPY